MTIERAAPAPPPRGTRPRNRRALIMAAATDLFYRRGYDHVGMGDIAEAVNIGPSALYRHFAGKQELLREIVLAGLKALHDRTRHFDPSEQAATLPAIAGLFLDHRKIGVLWQREARRIAAPERAVLRDELRGIVGDLAGRLSGARRELRSSGADLLSWATLSVLMSPSFHHLELPRPGYEALLAELAGIVLDTEVHTALSPPPVRPAGEPAIAPHSRREAILSQAISMFARHGYAGVGIEDIGAAAGVGGASVYTYFTNKADLLNIALDRGTALLYMDLREAYTSAAGAADALQRLVRSYARLAIAHHDIVDLLITETGHLPDDRQRDVRQTQHAYIDEWVHLTRLVHPQFDATAARVRVHAALTVANDIARTHRLRRDPGTPAAVERICTRLLRLPS